ncbi:MAG: Dabb family protein [Verrucomicrobiia bacterium]
MQKVKHITLLKFKEGTAEDQVQSIFDSILDITESVPGIEDYVSGPNSSPEGLSQGYTHALIMTFSDSAARDAYLSSPSHEQVKGLIDPVLDARLVIDFEV